MSPELDKKLVKDFPALYANRGGSIQQTCMAWGFECDDGWEPLIRNLSEQLTYLASVTGATFTAAQVKEKYGTLRFYFTTSLPEGASERIWEIAYAVVDRTENASAHTCETCGLQGHTRGKGWYRTLCPKHAYEAEYPLTDHEARQLGVTDHILESDKDFP